MQEPIFIGIDPGISGAVGVVDADGEVIDVFDLPVVKGQKGSKELHLASLIKKVRALTDGRRVYGAVEKVHSMPKQGVRSSFRFGKATGQLESMLVTLGIPLMLVTPQAWQKRFTRHVEGPDTKVRSVIAASYRWPDIDLPRKKDHNKAEALLLAEYCRMHHSNKLED